MLTIASLFEAYLNGPYRNSVILSAVEIGQCGSRILAIRRARLAQATNQIRPVFVNMVIGEFSVISSAQVVYGTCVVITEHAIKQREPASVTFTGLGI